MNKNILHEKGAVRTDRVALRVTAEQKNHLMAMAERQTGGNLTQLILMAVASHEVRPKVDWHRLIAALNQILAEWDRVLADPRVTPRLRDRVVSDLATVITIVLEVANAGA
jgi:uncharacterized protein (DUF1778 family)